MVLEGLAFAATIVEADGFAAVSLFSVSLHAIKKQHRQAKAVREGNLFSMLGQV
jgi:hypothetical protein